MDTHTHTHTPTRTRIYRHTCTHTHANTRRRVHIPLICGNAHCVVYSGSVAGFRIQPGVVICVRERCFKWSYGSSLPGVSGETGTGVKLEICRQTFMDRQSNIFTHSTYRRTRTHTRARIRHNMCLSKVVVTLS